MAALIVFSSSPNASQLANLYWLPADGSGEPHRLTKSDDRQHPTFWHPSGKYVAFEQQVSQEEWDLMILPRKSVAGLESEDSNTLPGKDRAAFWRRVFPGWTVARLCVERIRPLESLRPGVSGARRPVAGVDLGRLGSGVVAAGHHRTSRPAPLRPAPGR